MPLLQTCAMIFCARLSAADADRPTSSRSSPTRGCARDEPRSPRSAALAAASGPDRPRRSCRCSGWCVARWSGRCSRPIRPARSSTSTSSAPSQRQFWLGSDYLGRDMLSRAPARRALHRRPRALRAALLACAPGMALGLIAAVSGGWLDELLSRADGHADLDSRARSSRLVVVAAFGSSHAAAAADRGGHLHARRLPHRPRAGGRTSTRWTSCRSPGPAARARCYIAGARSCRT